MSLDRSQLEAIEALDHAVMAKVPSAFNGHTIELPHETALTLRSAIHAMQEELAELLKVDDGGPEFPSEIHTP